MCRALHMSWLEKMLINLKKFFMLLSFDSFGMWNLQNNLKSAFTFFTDIRLNINTSESMYFIVLVVGCRIPILHKEQFFKRFSAGWTIFIAYNLISKIETLIAFFIPIQHFQSRFYKYLKNYSSNSLLSFFLS